MSGQSDVPRLRDQAKTLVDLIHTTLADPTKRETVAKDSTKYFTALANAAKQQLSDADTRAAMMEHGKALAAAAQQYAKDPEKRSSLMAMVQSATAVAHEHVKDPAKRQELHDLLASTTHTLMTSMVASPPGGAAAAAAAPVPEVPKA